MSKVSGGSPSVKSKAVYRVKNWSSYNRALVARGSLTVWLDDSFWPQWYDHRPSQRGAQFVYSDPTIEWMLTMRVLVWVAVAPDAGVYPIAVGLMGLALAVPDYSTLSRAKGPWRWCCRKNGLIARLARCTWWVDSTGLKVYGEGE